MSKIQLYSNDRIRVTGDFKEKTFIDINGHKEENGFSLDLYTSMIYIEIREKDNSCKMFLFESKRHKKYFDFGYWQDAKVIFSLNKK